jgi:predicted nucleotidyltransferase
MIIPSFDLVEKAMEEKLKELITRLRDAHEENLECVILHGSALASNQSSRRSDYNLLIVTRSISSADLRRTRPVAKWWVEEGFSLPVYFTKEEFLESIDVFPIEFRQIKRAYRVLYGTDMLSGVEASKAHLRIQTEYELRGKLLRLRALYLPAGDSAERLTRLMTDSVVNFVQFMRPVLEIVGEDAPVGRVETVRRVGEKLQIDTTVFERILRLRTEPVDLMEIEIQQLFATYLDSIARLIEAVDNL